MSDRNIPPITPAGTAVFGSTATNQATGPVNTLAPVASNGYSAVLDTKNSPFVSAFGHASGATTINLLYSADGTNFYVAHALVLTGAGDFCIDCLCGAQFVQLQSTSAVNIWATISAKGGGG